MNKISVIIPSYNHGKFIGKAIESVLNQTNQDFEIVIVDDASNDNSCSVICSYAEKDPRIKFVRFKKNQGACVAMNRCLAEASGEYIAVLNSDDMFAPNKLEYQLNYLEKNKTCGAVFTWVEVVDEFDQKFTGKNNYVGDVFEEKNRSRFEWLHYFFYNGNCLCHPSLMIRRECYQQVGNYNEAMTQLPDFDMWIRLCLKYDIYIMPEKLVKYRLLENGENASALAGSSFIRHQFDYYKLMDSFTEMTFSDFQKVFPLVCNTNTNITEKTYPYFIAREALKLGIKPVQFWAINKIYSLLQDQSIKSELENKHNFCMSDFHKLYSDYDFFSEVFNNYTQLFIDKGEGFNEKDSILKPFQFNDGRFNFNFEFTETANIANLRWDPVRQDNCQVDLDNTFYIDRNNNKHSLKTNIIGGSGKKINDFSFRFTSGDPQLVFKINDEIKSFHVIGSWKSVEVENNSLKISPELSADPIHIVSIIIPAYNDGETIENTIKMILSKPFQDFEIIIADDNSNDDTVEKAEALSLIDNRINLIKIKDKNGFVSAVNAALSKASGRYISILDPSNHVCIDLLEAQIEYLEKNPSCGAAIIQRRERKNASVLFPGNFARQDLLRYYFYHGIPLCDLMVIRRTCVMEFGGFDPKLTKLYYGNLLISILTKYDIHISENKDFIPAKKSELNLYTDLSEISYVLSSYFLIAPEDIDKVFPQFEGMQIPKETVPFFVACAALSNKSLPAVYKFFGIQTIYEIMDNESIRKSLNDLYHFSYEDFISFVNGSQDTLCSNKYCDSYLVDTDKNLNYKKSLFKGWKHIKNKMLYKIYKSLK